MFRTGEILTVEIRVVGTELYNNTPRWKIDVPEFRTKHPLSIAGVRDEFLKLPTGWQGWIELRVDQPKPNQDADKPWNWWFSPVRILSAPPENRTPVTPPASQPSQANASSSVPAGYGPPENPRDWSRDMSITRQVAFKAGVDILIAGGRIPKMSNEEVLETVFALAGPAWKWLMGYPLTSAHDDATEPAAEDAPANESDSKTTTAATPDDDIYSKIIAWMDAKDPDTYTANDFGAVLNRLGIKPTEEVEIFGSTGFNWVSIDNRTWKDAIDHVLAAYLRSQDDLPF